MMMRWCSKEDPEVVIVVLEETENTVAVYNDGEDNATVFHLSVDELHFNFEPIE